MRVLALDPGAARCGVALSDPSGTIATPLEPVLRPNTRRGIGAIRALVRQREVGRVVVGLPVGLRGADTEQTREARAFAERLAAALAPVPVELEDERFTTAIARRLGEGARTSEDSRAAAVLLEGWLARQDATEPPGVRPSAGMEEAE